MAHRATHILPADVLVGVIDQARCKKHHVKLALQSKLVNGAANTFRANWNVREHVCRKIDCRRLQRPFQQNASKASRASTQLQNGRSVRQELPDGIQLAEVRKAAIEFDGATVSGLYTGSCSAKHSTA